MNNQKHNYTLAIINTKRLASTAAMKSLLRITLLISATSLSSHAASIALNFSQNTSNQNFAGGSNIGPTSIDSSNFNNTNNFTTGAIATGTKENLVNDSGIITTVDASWSSGGVYYNREDGVGDDENKLVVGYLDDGGSGISINLTNISYSSYNVYVLFSSDEGQGTATSYTATNNLIVNGSNLFGQIITGDNTATTATAYGSLIDANAGGSSNWVEITGDGAGNQTQTGNYALLEGQAGDLTITSTRSGGRGSIAGVIIEDTSIPEPSTTLLIGLGGLTLLRRKRV